MDVIEKANRAIKIVQNEPLIAFDVETNGLDWKENVPIGYVITSPEESLYIPVRHTGGGNLNDNYDGGPQHLFEMDLAAAFAGNPTALIVGHNLKFDMHFAANAGIQIDYHPVSCTQNNEALLDEYSKSFALEAVAKSHRVTPKKSEDMYRHLSNTLGVANNKSSMGHYHELPGTDPMVVSYAEGDGVTTLELYNKQVLELSREGLTRVWRMENQLIGVLFRMERHGIRANAEVAEKLRRALISEAELALKRLPPDFNVRSPKQMKEYISMFRTDWPKTSKGNPSFTEEWLSTFPQGQHIVNIRQNTNLVNSFITPLLERHISEGRVHPNFTQNKRDEGGTVSGRLSSGSPNIQQVPKHNKVLAKKFRRIFEADPGMIICEMDYSQCEPRLFAHYSGDENLLKGYRADPPQDVHSIVAELFDLPRDTTAKRMNMGMFTGMYPKTFSRHMGVTLPEATALRNEWLELFPGVKEFQGKAKEVLSIRKYVKTLLGRRGRLEHPRFAYRAVSKIIQGGNADILKYKMVKLDHMLKETNGVLLATVHDSFLIEVPDDKMHKEMLNTIVNLLEDVQSPPFNLQVPFKIDMNYGRNWADASFR